VRLTPSLIALTLAATALTACSSNDKGAAPNDDYTQGQTTPAGPQSKQVAWGQPAEVLGTNLRKMRVTPVGVLYHRGPYNGVDGPQEGWFVAIAVRAEAIGSPEAPAGGAGGGGFSWRGGGETIDGIGSSVSAPWEGSVNGFGVDTPLEPGSPEIGIVTYYVPTKAGGRLLYISPEDQSIVSWPLPAADQGTGLDAVRKQIKRFS
jgi:hypothetical protein